MKTKSNSAGWIMSHSMMKSLLMSAVFVIVAAAHEPACGASGAEDLGCRDGRKPVGDLGITAMSFKGSMSYNSETGEHKWYFQAEPKIREIDRNGPAAGKLQSGDVLVAIDGMAITTNKAGQRFAGIVPGETVSLSVRRKGRVIDTVITPRAVCPEDHPMRIESFGLGETRRELEEARRDLEATDLELDRISEALESLSEIEIFRQPEIPGRPKPPRRPEVPRRPEARPRAWFGMRLACDGCTITRTKEDPTLKWLFDEPPRVRDVEPGSPADSAGVLEGDVITHVDGIRIDKEKGGRRFSSIEPGDTVTWTMRRDGKTRTVRMAASDRPRDEVVPSSYEDAKALYDFQRSPVRFSGTVAGAEVEVRGDETARVFEDEGTGEILIRTCGAEIRVRAQSKTLGKPGK